MLDDDTIEMLLGPGTMPGTEDTLTMPVIVVGPYTSYMPDTVDLPPGCPPHPGVPPLPRHLMGDPILEMAKPQSRSAWDTYFADRPTHIPGRPLRGPRMRITWRDQLLAAMGAGVVLLALAAYVEVHEGWNAEMPSQSRPVVSPYTPESPGTSEDPRMPQDPTPAPSSHAPVEQAAQNAPQESSGTPMPTAPPSPAPMASQAPPSAPAPSLSPAPSLTAAPAPTDTGPDTPAGDASSTPGPQPSLTATVTPTANPTVPTPTDSALSMQTTPASP